MTTHNVGRDGLHQVEGKDQLQCGVCGQLGDSILNFIHHKISHVDRGVGRGCEICQLAFSRQTALCEHYKRKHGIFFDSTPEQADIRAARLKSRVKEKVKVIKEKKKSSKGDNLVETGITLTENVIQQTAIVNVPNGIMYKVKLESTNLDTPHLNDTKVLGSIDSWADSSVVGGPTSLTETVVLPGTDVSHGTEALAVSAARGDTVLYGSAVLAGSSVFVGSSNLTGSSTSSDSAVLVDSSTLTGSTPLSCSATSDGSLVLSDTINLNGNSSLVDLYQPNNSQNHVRYEKDGNTFTAKTCSDLDRKNNDLNSGPQYFVVKTFGKQDSHVTTESFKQIETEVTENNVASELDDSLTENSKFIAKKLDVCSAEVLHGSHEDMAKIVSSTNNTVVAVENTDSKYDSNFVEADNNFVEDQKKENERTNLEKMANSEKMASDRNDNADKSVVPAAQNKLHCTRIFKKRGKLAPVPGKIPQELDMPDFYFLNVVTKSGKNLKNMHVGKDQFKCIFCTYVVRWRTSMCRHMREEHDTLLRSGATLIMPLQLNTEEGKLMKMTEYIAMESEKKPSKRIRGIESQDLPGEFPCEQCGKVFSRIRYLRLHTQLHKKKNKNDLLCALCSKTFKSQNNLIQHLKTHEEREPYKCPECDFESAVNIAIHKHRQIHSANSLICDICGQAYSDKSTLKKHKQVHDPSRPFGCSIPGCTWRFRSQVMCDAHIQGHGSKREFKCDICGYAFRQKHHLQRHEKVVHNIIHEPKASYTTFYNNTHTDFNENQFEDISNDDQNEMEVSEGVNVIINEGNMSNVISADHFDLESALQNGQLVIATDDGSINYEMSDIGSNVVYQTLLPEGEVQQFETQTICIPPSDTSQMAYEEVETIQSEVEIEHS